MFRLTILFFALFIFATQAFDNNKATGNQSSNQEKWRQHVSLAESQRQP